jgi:eukaryotic-like serine/threonine-protein kinase
VSDHSERRTVTALPTPRPAEVEAKGEHIGPSTVKYRQQAEPPGAGLAWLSSTRPALVPDAGLAPPVAPAPSPSPDGARLPGPGARIGKYEIIRELGRGGFGAVFAARDTKLGRKVAIKFLHGELQPEDIERFLREARATARASHENIVVIHDVGEHDGYPFMVLEYLQGVPLSKLLQAGRQLPPAQVVEYAVPIVRALDVAHRLNIVHRDLKPDNIFVLDSGIIKVLDFGIAKLVHGDAEIPLARGTGARTAVTLDDLEHTGPNLTQWDALMGTIPYMSPEQWRAAGEVDHQTDLWAVGIILWKMLTGRHPLGSLRSMEEWRIAARLDIPMPSIRQALPSVPDELAAIVDGCLRKPKDQRIGSARALLEVLEPLLPGRELRRLRADESPYAGLGAFQESDADKFFGRTSEVGAALARLRDAPLLGVVGPSGVGKSSFVRAGIVPALKASGESWSTLVVRPGRDPIAALAHALTSLIDDAETTSITSVTAATVSAELSQQQTMAKYLNTEPGYLGAMLRSRARSRGRRILVFVDQFEELYTQTHDPGARAAFIASLAAVADDATSPLRVVLSIRSDFLDRVVEHAQFVHELTRGLFFLAPPDRAGLRDALIQPAEMAGCQFEGPEMIEAMLDHLGHTPGALPLLQFAASQLWENRDRSRRLLTTNSYHRIGGIAGALASHADAVLAECTAREQTLVRALLLRLVTSERTRALVPVSELYELSPDPDEVHLVVDRLVRSRLLVGQTVTSPRGGTAAGGSVELVHESLIHSWPLLQRWLDETQEDAAYLEQLRAAARQWQAKGYAPGLLWRGDEMAEAKLWHSRYRGELPELQRAYLNAMFAAAAKATRHKRLAVIAALGFLSVLLIAAGVALVMIRDAQQDATAQARLAEERLRLTQAAQLTADTERKKADGERAKAVEANTKLEGQNAALVAAVDTADRARRDAEEARRRAEAAKREEQLSARRAAESAEAARAAEAEAKRAGEDLERLLAQERKRVKELEEQTRGAQIVPSVKKREVGELK